MNVSFVIDSISHSGGTDRVCTMLASALAEKGIHTSIHTLCNGKSYYDLDNRVKVFSYYSKGRLRSLFKIIQHEKKTKSVLIVISMGKLSVQFSFISTLLRMKNKRICSDHVAIESFSNVIRKLKIMCYSTYDNVVTLTNHDENIINSFLKNKKSKLTCIRNMSPYSSLDTLVNKGSTKTVIAVGRLSFQKNFSRLLDIWSKSESADWKLKIIGSGPEETQLRNKIVNLDLNNVEIIPANKNLERYYSEADFLLMTSRYEGLPMVLIEAKNFSLPVISFDCKTGPEEIISNDGFIIPYDSDELYLERLNLLFNDETVRAKLSENACANADFYSKKIIINEWLRVIYEK